MHRLNFSFLYKSAPILIHLFLIFTDCNPHGDPSRTDSAENIHFLPNISFYSFRTSFNPSRNEIEILNRIKPAEITFRLFDVDFDSKTDQAVPVSPLRITEAASKMLKNIKATKISGLIFITNRTLKNTEKTELPELAEKIIIKAESTIPPSNISIKELQIDCDWSISTRDKYFLLLEILKRKLKLKNIALAATVRLHQVKFQEKTGIPPADKGILMLYNMEDVGKWETQNSILNLKTAVQYLKRLENYPLPLDIALPLYSQTAVFSGGKLIGLISGDLTEQLSNNKCFIKISSNRYRSKKRCLLTNQSGSRIETAEGSLLRAENTDNDELMELLKIILKERKGIHRLFVFDLHQSLFEKCEAKNLDRIETQDYNRSHIKTGNVNSNENDVSIHQFCPAALQEISDLFSAYSLSDPPP